MGKITLKNVGKSFDKSDVITGLNLEIKDGSFTVLVGPSGCGKSTTLRMLAGLETVSSGDIYIDGKRINDLPPGKRDIAMVFQNYALYPTMTVKQNIEFGLKNMKMPKKERENLIQEISSIVGLTEYLDRKPSALSGGQRQRVALARAMVKKPKVFLMDEPLSNLDAKLRVQMRTELIQLHKRLGTTFVYVTHDQVEAMSMGDEIVIMNHGAIQQAAAPMEVYHQPANLFTAQFIGAPPMNIMERALIASPIVPAEAVFVGIRPEKIKLQFEKASDIKKISVEGTILTKETLGAETIYQVQTSAGNMVVRSENAMLPEDTSIFIVMDEGDLYFYNQTENRIPGYLTAGERELVQGGSIR